jgi:hypothetical protein
MIKKTRNHYVVLIIILIFGSLTLTINNVLAADITCPNAGSSPPYFVCTGTPEDDTMQGSSKPDNITGLAGNDQMIGGQKDVEFNVCVGVCSIPPDSLRW